MIVAIDGPAASGKGTLGRHVARHFGYHHLDTGLIYRAVARALLDSGTSLTDIDSAVEAARRLDLSLWPESVLRAAGMGEAASAVAVLAPVRAVVLDYQRDFARRPPGAVLDGRDIGTVVLPEADVKLYVTASDHERARRRTLELVAAGFPVDEQVVLADIRKRDAQDANRPVAPLKQADDAILLDTTDLTIEAALRAAVVIVEAAQLTGGPT